MTIPFQAQASRRSARLDELLLDRERFRPSRRVSAGEAVLVGVRHHGAALAIDPACECGSAPRRMAWMCPHKLAYLALSELSRLSALEGRIGEAIRAAELRSALPVSAEMGERIGFEVDALGAQLN
jgi:hypothetical protein